MKLSRRSTRAIGKGGSRASSAEAGADTMTRKVRLRRGRLFVLAVLALTLIGTGGWFWFRDSSLVAVKDVRVIGIKTGDQARMRQLLTDEARTMTTLHVRTDALRKALVEFASITHVTAQASFPHRLTVTVSQSEPVALLVGAGPKVPIAADGRLLPDITEQPGMVAVHAQRVDKGRVVDREALADLKIIAAAPVELRDKIAHIGRSATGISVTLKNGPELIFGDASGPRNKWIAAIRVLGEHATAGATYLDLRAKGRVAVGGIGGTPAQATPTATPSAAAAQATSTPVTGGKTRPNAAPLPN